MQALLPTKCVRLGGQTKSNVLSPEEAGATAAAAATRIIPHMARQQCHSIDKNDQIQESVRSVFTVSRTYGA